MIVIQTPGSNEDAGRNSEEETGRPTQSGRHKTYPDSAEEDKHKLGHLFPTEWKRSICKTKNLFPNLESREETSKTLGPRLLSEVTDRMRSAILDPQPVETMLKRLAGLSNKRIRIGSNGHSDANNV